MVRVRKDGSALRMTAFGLIAHYAYAIILFMNSQLTERIASPFITLYLAATGAPIILLCALVIKRGLRNDS